MEKIRYGQIYDAAIYLGIFLKVPIKHAEVGNYTERVEGCPSCDRWGPLSMASIYVNGVREEVPVPKFCDRCGTQRTFSEQTREDDNIPSPDIREDLKKLNLNYIPFNEDMYFDEEDDLYWIVPLIIYSSINERYDACEILSTCPIDSIQKDIEEQTKRVSGLIEKFGGEVFFGNVCGVG